MDINSLLSPSETPRSVSSTPTSPQLSPYKFVQRTQSGPGPGPGPVPTSGPGAGSLKHGHASSPLSQSVMNQSSIPAHVLSPGPQQAASPLISPVPATSNSQLSRSISNPSLDSLADLNSIQSQGSRPAALHVRNRDGSESSKSPAMYNPTLVASLTSNPRASFDINMMEAPKQSTRVDFFDTSLSDQQQQRLGDLTKYVQDTPSAYDSHVEIIKILHRGFIDHIYPPNDSTTRRDPHTYDLLPDLRKAREGMEKLFAIGEELWIDWLQDESILARTAEERIAVVESCRRAVEEEVGSISLWTAYGDWVRHCYNWAHDQSNETDEERQVGQELFTWQLVIDTWQEAVDQTASNLAQGHLVWNKFLSARIPNLQQKFEADQLSTYLALFEQRLQTPHSAWDETFQSFSSLVSSNFDGEQYEHIMSEMLRSATDAKKKMAVRESFETEIQQVQQSGDRDSEYNTFMNYIEWEQTPEKRKKLDTQLTVQLFQRAELRFPSIASIWEEHVVFLLSQSTPVLLPVLERATKHCPWSGSLWSQYLLSSDRAGQAFHETEGIKHKATSTGLLEAAGIEEVVKVHGAWCSYLRRRSFRPDGSEEDLDVAEMGIRSSIENVASLAAKLGLGEVADPSFRLHRIYIVFLSESGRWDNARQEFDNSVRDYGKSWEFWMLFYHWEMGRWRKFASSQQNSSDEQMLNVAPPHMATAVLKKALDQAQLDYPEPIMQALITHCEDFEDAEELQSAMMKVQKLQKAVARRRETEAAAAAAAAKAAFDPATSAADETLAASGPKRKREEEAIAESSNKRSKNEELVQTSVEETDSSQPKRDRENATVLVENLPDDVTDVRLRQYFSSCGIVRALKVLREDGVSAIIEFEDDNAAKYALSRDEQEFDGAILSVTLDTGSTLYLTNYKPSADEAYIRNLLEKYGEIISVRFPSLQGNKKRRFCYVQCKLPTEAQAASAELDGKKIDDYELTCKISNPAHRSARKEYNINDGHTIFVGQLNFKATEAEVEKAFSKFGTIGRTRMPLHPVMKTRNKGIAYITYTILEAAEEAANAMNGHSFMGRELKVELAANKSSGSHRHESFARSATPTQNGPTNPNGSEDTITRREGQVFLSNVPDTVNEAQFRDVASKYGILSRVILKTNHQGAILEFSDATQAGQASLKLEGYEITPGRPLHVVSESEMLANLPERKVDGFEKIKSKPKPSAAPIGNVAPVKRPQQPGVKKGGNLGQRSALLHPHGSKQQTQTQTNGGDKSEVKKSNADFKAMMNKPE